MEIRLIPPYLSSSVKSNAEKRTFAAIQLISAPAYCFHSLNLPEKIKRKPECEIDFLFLSVRGIMCLEVKGGSVRRVDGVWQFENRFGEVTKKIEGPFEQVQNAMYALKQRIKNKYGADSNLLKCLFGYGVIFPDTDFKDASAEWDLEIVCDKIRFNRPISDYITALHEYWALKKPQSRPLTNNEVDELAQYLRGDFHCVVPLKDYIGNINEELLSLTGEQLSLLAGLDQNPRLIINGPAGSGKTLMAVEKAKCEAARGQKTLLICSSDILAEHLQHMCSEYINLSVTNIFALFKSIQTCGDLSDIKKPIRENEYKIDLPLILKRQKLIDSAHLYDSIIVDEAQDILKSTFLEVLNGCLKGGFQNGRWTLFYDKFRQAGLYGDSDSGVASILEKFKPTLFNLGTNCRNTKKIAEETEMITNYIFQKILHDGGRKSRVEFYKDIEERNSTLLSIMSDLAKQDISKGRQIILTLENETNFLNSVSGIHGYKFQSLSKFDQFKSDQHLNLVCEAKRFKGLESDIVIIPEIKSFDQTVELYVAMTRAKAMLFLLIDSSLKKQYQERFKLYVERKVLI